MRRVTGNIVFVDLEGGFYGLQTSDQNYFPLNLPEQIKYLNKEISCTIVTMDDIMTMQSWGTPCLISSFSTS